MRPSTLVLSLLVFAQGCRQPAARISAEQSLEFPPPVNATFVSVRGGKPPMRLYVVDLKLVNQHDYPVWMVLPDYGDKPLPANDALDVNKDNSIKFGQSVLSQSERSDVYHWEKARSRGIEAIGWFNALHLKPHETLQIKDCGIECWTSIKEFEVFEARDIVINGKTPVAQWLATRVLATEGRYVTLSDANRDPASPGKILHGAKQADQDAVMSVHFSEMHRWKVPMVGVERVPSDP